MPGQIGWKKFNPQSEGASVNNNVTPIIFGNKSKAQNHDTGLPINNSEDNYNK